MYTKISFDRADEAYDENRANAEQLTASVMDAFNRRFADYGQGAAALAEYRRVKTEIDNDPNMTMFGVLEAFRAAIEAHPAARNWAVFEQEATAAIQPFYFSMHFIGD